MSKDDYGLVALGEKFKMKKKENIVIIPKKVMDEIPEDAKEEFEEAITKLQKGDFSDSHEIDMQDVTIKLRCGSCNSDTINWFIDKNADEVYYNCKCGTKGWMTQKEYDKAVKENPEMIIQ